MTLFKLKWHEEIFNFCWKSTKLCNFVDFENWVISVYIIYGIVIKNNIRNFFSFLCSFVVYQEDFTLFWKVNHNIISDNVDTYKSWQCVQHTLYYQYNIRGDRKHEDVMWNFVVDLDTNCDWSFFTYSHNFASSKHRDLTFSTFFLCCSLKPYMSYFFKKVNICGLPGK